MLGPGPRSGVRSVTELEGDLKTMLRDAPLSAAARDLIRALVLLRHDHLDEAHTISQGIENADGSFVHAIVHRREPDYSNSNYWWRFVGRHAAFGEISKRVTTLLSGRNEPDLLATLIPNGEWNPSAFVAACQKKSAPDELLREIQKVESEALLDFLIG